MDRALNASQLVYSRRDSLLSFSFALVLSKGGKDFFFQAHTNIVGFYLFSVEKKVHRKNTNVSRRVCQGWRGILDY